MHWQVDCVTASAPARYSSNFLIGDDSHHGVQVVEASFWTSSQNVDGRLETLRAVGRDMALVIPNCRISRLSIVDVYRRWWCVHSSQEEEAGLQY